MGDLQLGQRKILYCVLDATRHPTPLHLYTSIVHGCYVRYNGLTAVSRGVGYQVCCVHPTPNSYGGVWVIATPETDKWYLASKKHFGGVGV